VSRAWPVPAALLTQLDKLAESDPAAADWVAKAKAEVSEVLALPDCTNDEKIAILLNWQRALVQLQAASEENMLRDDPGNSDVADPLAEVTRALTELGYTGDPAAA